MFGIEELLIENCNLDHIGIAVNSLEKSQKFYELLGLKFCKNSEVVKDQLVTTKFAPIDIKSKIELLEPIDKSGPIQEFINKKGEGIHHICFEVPNLEEHVKKLKASGIVLVYEKNRIGAHDKLINFIHPKSAGGVLIELAQKEG